MESKVSMLTKWTPRSSSEEDNEGGGTLESVVRTMFGSCTTFDPVNEEEEESTSFRRRERNSKSSRRRESSSASARAKQAVYSLREKAEQRETSPSNRKPSVSRPFPVSSPQRKGKQEVPYLVHEVVPPPPPPNVPELGSATFDDGISAISAHTLEELDRQNKLKKPHKFNAVHSDLTHEGFEAPIKNTVSNESSLFPAEGEERDCVGESIEFSRGRSNQTWGSKKTFQSMSTASTDFENVWRQEEQKYWQETVQKEEKAPAVRQGSVRRHNMTTNERARRRSREQVSLK